MLIFRMKDIPDLRPIRAAKESIHSVHISLPDP